MKLETDSSIPQRGNPRKDEQHPGCPPIQPSPFHGSKDPASCRFKIVATSDRYTTKFTVHIKRRTAPKINGGTRSPSIASEQSTPRESSDGTSVYITPKAASQDSPLPVSAVTGLVSTSRKSSVFRTGLFPLNGHLRAYVHAQADSSIWLTPAKICIQRPTQLTADPDRKRLKIGPKSSAEQKNRSNLPVVGRGPRHSMMGAHRSSQIGLHPKT